MGINEDKLFEISVTATPYLGSPKTLAFSNDTSDLEIAKTTIPLVAKSNVKENIKCTQEIIGNMKSIYTMSDNDSAAPSESTVCHNLKLQFDGGILEFDLKKSESYMNPKKHK